MKPTRNLIRAVVALPAVLALALPAAHAQVMGPGREEVLMDNLKNLLCPDDEGGIGSGEKDSLVRLNLGKYVVLRGDAKLVGGWIGDARGKNGDETVVDYSANGLKDDEDDAKKAWGPQLDAVAGGAVDVVLGMPIEAFSVEYKKDLIPRNPKEFFKPKDPNEKKAPLWQSILKNDDLTIKIAGFTVRCPDEQDEAGALGKSFDAKDKDGNPLQNSGLLKNGLKLQFMAGPVPIIVRGNAGLSLNFNFGPAIDIEHSAFGFEFEPGAYVHGWLSVGVGGAVPGFSVCAGILGKLRLLDTTVGCGLGVVLTDPWAMYSGVKVTLQPVKFEAQLFVAVQALWLSKTFAWTVFTAQMKKSEWQFGSVPADFFPAPPPPLVGQPPTTETPGTETPGRERPATEETTRNPSRDGVKP